MCAKLNFLKIAEFIKETRIKNNLSIKELSIKTGLSIYKIKRIESGNYDFNFKDFNKLKNVLDIDFIITKSPSS